MNRLAVRYGNVGTADLRESVLPEYSLDPEIESGMIGQPVFVAILNEPLWNSPSSSSLSRLAAGTLREDTDGSAALDLLTSGENHLQTLLDVGTVEKQAVDEFHPVL